MRQIRIIVEDASTLESESVGFNIWMDNLTNGTLLENAVRELNDKLNATLRTTIQITPRIPKVSEGVRQSIRQVHPSCR